MITEHVDDHEVTSDGVTVWVNGTGGTVARFGRNGIDVHTADATGCIDCTHDVTTLADWHRFVGAVIEYHGVHVGQHHRPKRFIVTPAPRSLADEVSEYLDDQPLDHSPVHHREMAHASTLTDREVKEMIMGEIRTLDGCVVEPDGTCQHGWRSPLLVLGLISW